MSKKISLQFFIGVYNKKALEMDNRIFWLGHYATKYYYQNSQCDLKRIRVACKGQIKPKVDLPKNERTNLFSLPWKAKEQTNKFVCSFFGTIYGASIWSLQCLYVHTSHGTVQFLIEWERDILHTQFGFFVWSKCVQRSVPSKGLDKTKTNRSSSS